jgi:hypothetical protein
LIVLEVGFFNRKVRDFTSAKIHRQKFKLSL